MSNLTGTFLPVKNRRNPTGRSPVTHIIHKHYHIGLLWVLLLSGLGLHAQNPLGRFGNFGGGGGSSGGADTLLAYSDAKRAVIAMIVAEARARVAGA